MSKIEWTDETLNPVTGCTKISAGCKHCYAERMAKRLQVMGQPNYANGFKVTLHPDVMQKALRWRKPRMVFVCSMSDLFHKDVPFDFIQGIFDVMAQTPQHTYQVLTKRPERMAEFAGCMVGDWPVNVWAGASIENQENAGRLAHLVNVPAQVRFLSCEPLLGPLSLQFRHVHWVIVGGESGPGARPMDADWVRSIQRQCEIDSVPFFFKQWGGVNKKATGRLLDSRTWDEMPMGVGSPARSGVNNQAE